MTQKKILVVDDNSISRTILCNILKADDYATLEAENGQAALDVLRAEGYAISLVLLDILMPVMDGYALLKAMTANGMIKRVPVIVTTGAEDESSELCCLENGASDFLKKPYNAKMVRHRVKSLLRLWDNAALISKLEIDVLTGVYSREFFYRHSEQILDEHAGEPYCIVYADVDDFKMINVRYGAAVGEELLRYLAARFQKMVGKNGACGRIGGDRFVLLFREKLSQVKAQIEGLQNAEFKDAPVKGFQLKYGIYPVKDRLISTADMCDRAKLAVTMIKHQYGICYAVYDDSMLAQALKEHQLADCMEAALEKRQFSVYLQPKHCTENRAVAGAEALVRWNHPELGFISPGEFISLFERNGFITKVDGFMLQEVCRMLRDWIDRGINPVPISVNVSRADFVFNDLPLRIAAYADGYGIPHELIHLEVTESAYTENPQQIVAAVSALQDMGFVIEMDDFGSGYSSLNMLSELPIDILKLDMRFMQSGNDRIKGGKRNILSFIVSLSKWLQLPTTAEGVETQAEFELLKSMGCNLIQGYYFSKPMPAENFVTYMKEHPAQCKQAESEVSFETLPAVQELNKEMPLILVTEDIESNREIMKMLLSGSYQVATVGNGQEACEYLLAHHHELSCVLLDLLMPVMDGFQVLEFMRHNSMIDEVPVIITTENGNSSELRALHLGADSFVGKPYNPEILLHHVQKAVEKKEFLRLKHDFDCKKCELYEKAYKDELTGLLNRHGLKEAVTSLSNGEKYAALMLDIDNLKQINDSRGHAIGDEVIRVVAETLKNVIRSGDAVARMGGDEFAILLQGVDDLKIARCRGERLCGSIKEATVPDVELQLSGSVGVTLACQSENFADVVKRADAALYRAKRGNKGGCCL